MIATEYHKRRLGGLLKRGEACIEGKTSGGQRWPDPPHYWVVTDFTRQEVYHVPVEDRPSWGKYEKGWDGICVVCGHDYR
jgi:hypothetical protein